MEMMKAMAVWAVAVGVLCATAWVAEARPGKPFHPCGSYIVALSFSLSHPQPQPHSHPVFFHRARPLPAFYQRHGLPTNFVNLADRFPEERQHRPRLGLRFDRWRVVSSDPNPMPMPIHPHHHQPHHHHHMKGSASPVYKTMEDVVSILIALLLGALTGVITATLIHFVWRLVNSSCHDGDAVSENEKLPVSSKDGYQSLPVSENEKLPVSSKDGYQSLPVKEGVEYGLPAIEDDDVAVAAPAAAPK